MGLIGQIRERVGLLVGAIAVSMVLFLLMDALDSQTGFIGAKGIDGVGTIDGQAVTPQEYENKVTQIVSNYEQNGMEVTEEMRLQAREQAWRQIQEERIAQREYDRLGIAVTDAEMEQLLYSGGENLHQSVKSAPLFQNDSGQFDRSKLEQYVKSFSGTNADAAQRRSQWKRFEEGVYKETLRNKYTNLLKKAIYVPTWYAKAINAEKNSKANISYVMIPYTGINDADVNVSDSELLSYLNQHKNEFKQKPARVIDFVTFPVTPSATDSAEVRTDIAAKTQTLANTDNIAQFIGTSESEQPFSNTYKTKDELSGMMRDTLFKVPLGTTVGPFYESGAYRAIRIIDRRSVADSADINIIFKAYSPQVSQERAEKMIDSAKAIIIKGTSFATVSDSISDDPQTKEKKGNLGYVKRKQPSLPEDLHNTIFYEHKSGDIFTHKMDGGLFLVQVGKTGGVSEGVKAAYLTRSVEPSETTLNGIYGKAQQFIGASTNADQFVATANQQGLQIKSSNELTTSDFRIEGLGIASDIVTWAFQNNAGAVSDRVFEVENKLPDGRITSNYVIPIVKKAKEEGIAKLDDVRKEVEGEVKKQKKAEQIIAKLGQVTSLEQAATANGQQVQTAADASFEAPSLGTLGRELKVQGMVFALQPNQISKPISGDRGVYLVQVTSQTPAPEASDIAALKNELAQPLQGRADFQALQSLTKAAEIKDNRMQLQR